MVETQPIRFSVVLPDQGFPFDLPSLATSLARQIRYSGIVDFSEGRLPSVDA
jgi:hypothetical protein